MASSHPDIDLVSRTIADLQAWLLLEVADPTSQVTGGGAIQSAEERFSALHRGRASLMVPSATYGMRAALLALGVGPGTRVLIPGVDWGSTLAAVRSVGAEPVPVPVDPETETISPEAVRALVDSRTAAVIACHLHGVPADVPGIRSLIGSGIPIIEDCAQALGSTLDGAPVGTLADVAVFSFGPGKAIDAGEAAIITCRTPGLRTRLLAITAHPVRQLLAGIGAPQLDAFSVRPAPVSAIRLALALTRWSPEACRAEHAETANLVRSHHRFSELGTDDRRASAAPVVPVRDDEQVRDYPGLVRRPSAALCIAELLSGRHVAARVSLLSQLRRPSG